MSKTVREIPSGRSWYSLTRVKGMFLYFTPVCCFVKGFHPEKFITALNYSCPDWWITAKVHFPSRKLSGKIRFGSFITSNPAKNTPCIGEIYFFFIVNHEDVSRPSSGSGNPLREHRFNNTQGPVGVWLPASATNLSVNFNKNTYYFIMFPLRPCTYGNKTVAHINACIISRKNHPVDPCYYPSAVT